MPVQVKPDDPLRRRFNPERDLVWMLPRIIERGLMTFGMLTEPKLRQLLTKVGLDTDAEFADFKEFIERLTDFLAAAAHPEENSNEAMRVLLAELYSKTHSGIRLLVFDRVMKVIMAEYPIWCDQVRPESKRDPRPPVEEIEKARDALLGRLPS